MVENNDLLHVSYRLVPNHQGKGFASEATTALIYFCKQELKLETISVLIDPNNEPSLKVAKRVGFAFHKKSIIQGVNIDIYQIKFKSKI